MTCAIDGCNGVVLARGWCSRHWQRWHKTGTTAVLPPPTPVIHLCTVFGCMTRAPRRGWCGKHYKRWKTHGDPTYSLLDLEVRFWSKVDATGDCWEWTAAFSNWGYGAFWHNGRMQDAHVVAWEILIGPAPKGLTPDHLCRNHACVNVGEHIEWVTSAVNKARGYSPAAINARKTHCPKGHLYAGSNLRYNHADGTGGRRCAACIAERYRLSRQLS